jgi:hypothetical protein
MQKKMKKLLAFGVLTSMALITGCYYGPCMSGSGQVITETRDVAGFTEVRSSGSFEVYVTQADEFSVEVVTYENLMPIIETYVSGYALIIDTKDNSCYKSGQPIKVYVSLPELQLLELNGSGKLMAGLTESESLECANNGSGYLAVDSVYSDNLFLSNSGSGHLEVSGIYSEAISMVQSGSGTIDLGEIVNSREVSIKHSSSGNVRSLVVGGLYINAILSGSGRIDLSGDVNKADYTLNASGRIDALDLMAYDARTTSSGSGLIYVWATEYLEATVSGSGDILYRGEPQTSFRVSGSGSIKPY